MAGGKKEYPKYSVLMSIYYKDNPEDLKCAMNSMLQQSISPSEFVIVCDGEITKELKMTIEYYEKKYKPIFRIIRIKENVGLGPALKRGIDECKYEFIARMDADDYSVRERVKKQLKKMVECPNLGIVGSNVDEFIESIQEPVAHVVLPEKDDEIRVYSKRRCPYRHSAIMYRKSVVQKAGNYRKCYLCEDYDLYARIEMCGFEGYNIQEVLSYVRVSPDFYKRRGGVKYLKSLWRFKIGLYKNGFYHKRDLAIGLSAHTVVCLMPNRLRELVYKKKLRG